MRICRFLPVIVCAFLLLGPAPVSQADTIDQSFVPPASPGGLNAGIDLTSLFTAQTYTAGLTGVLTGVNIDVVTHPTTVAGFPMQVAIYGVSGGVPTTILGSTLLPANTSAPLSTLITFPTAIAQIAGSQYAIVVSYVGVPSPFGLALGTWHGATGGYSGGGYFYSPDGISWTFGGGDLHFQTHVNNVVPEPGTLVLLGSGLAGIWLRRRRG